MKEDMSMQAVIVLELEPKSANELSVIRGITKAIDEHSKVFDKSVDGVLYVIYEIFDKGRGKCDRVISLALAHYFESEIESGLTTHFQLENFVITFRTRLEPKVQEKRKRLSKKK